MSHSLGQVKRLQDAGPLLWPYLKINEHRKPVMLYMPVLCVLGDMDGHDQMIGRYVSRMPNVKFAAGTLIVQPPKLAIHGTTTSLRPRMT
jgi:hypothetical protein